MDQTTAIRSGAIRSAPRRRAGRTILSVLIFLFMFSLLLALLAKFYIGPSIEALSHLSKTNPDELRKRHAMAANALLVLMLLLTLLLVGILITFRIGRLFFPRPTAPRTRTKVVDAWAEAGKRMEEKADDGEAEE